MLEIGDPSDAWECRSKQSLPQFLVVRPSWKAASVQEHASPAKAQEGKLAYASRGSGGPSYLASEILKSMAGITMTHVYLRKRLFKRGADMVGEAQQRRHDCIVSETFKLGRPIERPAARVG